MSSFTSTARSRNRRSTTAALLVSASGLAAAILPASGASAQPFQLVTETGSAFPVGSTTWYSGALGVPSLSAPISSTGHWNLAVRSSSHFFGSSGDRVLFFTNSGVPLDQYAIAASDDSLPSAQFNRAAYLTNSGVYSGSSLLTPYSSLGFVFGRPSAQGAFIAGVEWPIDLPGSSGIVINGPSGSNLLVHAVNEGFASVGRASGPGAASDISFKLGGGGNVVFRGHHATSASRNGIFAKLYDGTMATGTVADNTMTNPLTGSAFAFSSGTSERLPVVQGTGAAWTDASGAGVLSKPDINGSIKIASQGLGTYGNVSSAGGGMLAYEVIPPSGGATQIWQNLMGVETLAVDRSQITQRTVLGLNMGSEALVANSKPFSFTRGGGYTLGFNAYQYNPHTEHAVYVKSIQQSGIDLGGLFGGNVHNNTTTTAQFSVKGGGSTGGIPGDSDFFTLTARNDWGHTLQPYQTYGSGLGVNSGTPADDPSRINTNDGKSESLQIVADYDMTLGAVTFIGLDIGESVRFLLDGVLVRSAIFEGNQVTMMSGLQYVDLGSLLVPAGSYFAIEHGGGFDDGFAVSSVIFNVVPSPAPLALLGLGGLVAARRRG